MRFNNHGAAIFHFGFMVYLLMAIVVLILLGFLAPPIFNSITELIEEIVISIKG